MHKTPAATMLETQPPCMPYQPPFAETTAKTMHLALQAYAPINTKGPC